MSRRMKFVLIVWVGPAVSAMKKAKLSTDKAFVKQVFQVSLVDLYMSPIERKQDFCLCENKGAAKLITAFVFTTQIVHSLFFFDPICQASSPFL